MRKFDTFKMVEKLIGHIDFYGESNHDRVSYENLEELFLLIEKYMQETYNLIHYHSNDYRASGKALACRVYNNFKFLKETIDEGIELFEENNKEVTNEH